MKNMKTEPSEKTIIYRTPGDPIEITDEMLENAEINPNELVDIILQKGCIIIKPTSVLGRLPEDLLLLYEELGFSREMVECVFTKYAEEAGGFDALVEHRQSIPAHEYRKNKVFAVGHQASVYRFSDGLSVAD